MTVFRRIIQQLGLVVRRVRRERVLLLGPMDPGVAAPPVPPLTAAMRAAGR